MIDNQASRRMLLQVAGSLLITLALAACDQSSANSTAAAATTTSAAQQTSAGTRSVTSSPTTTARSSPQETSAAPRAPAVPSGTAAIPTAAATIKLTIDPAHTEASYAVQEQLAGHDFPSQAIGRTNAISGAIFLDSSGKILSKQSKIAVDLRTLKSDQSMRDHYIQNNPLQTAQYPFATFIPINSANLPWPLPASGTAQFTLSGDMTVHGVTKPVSWSINASFSPTEVTGTATMPFTFTEFGMQAPHTMIALSVQNNGTLALNFTAQKIAT